MKRIFQLLIVAAVATCVALPASAKKVEQDEKKEQSSTKEQKTTTTTFEATIDCSECEKKVMNTLPYYKGVKDVEVELKSKTIKVKYTTSKCSDQDIIKELSKIDIKAKVK